MMLSCGRNIESALSLERLKYTLFLLQTKKPMKKLCFNYLLLHSFERNRKKHALTDRPGLLLRWRGRLAGLSSSSEAHSCLCALCSRKEGNCSLQLSPGICGLRLSSVSAGKNLFIKSIKCMFQKRASNFAVTLTTPAAAANCWAESEGVRSTGCRPDTCQKM